METKIKKKAALLGGRIGLTFLIVSSILVFMAYFILSQNFKTLLTNYTIDLVKSMVNQGVTTIEYELKSSKEEVAILANSFSIPLDEKQTIVFPTTSFKSDVLRIIYTSENNSIASDGRKYDLKNRPDIIDAYNGKTSVYGPYFNEENEYIICYSSPIFKDDTIVGVLSIEKDGYYFCDLIKELSFVNTGESYIINSEGTDIAVSDLEHIDWVNDQYNAKELYKAQKDPSTLSVIELEQKGLNGESGVGTYYWEDNLCYVVYAPIPSVQWVLLAGLRQNEINAMTQSVLYTSIAKGPVLSISIIIFFLLIVIIIFWTISSMKKSAEINEKLNIIANYDPLTGIMNRNGYHTALDALSNGKYLSLACIYIDANGLHEINNHLGHQAGDKMLKTLADILLHVFSKCDVYRIGGDEFVVLCKNQDKYKILHQIEIAKQSLKKQGYEISVGIEWRNEDMNIKAIVNLAEEAMQQDKKRYYRENGKERQLRVLDQELEQMVLEKQDADTFLSVLAPEFKGVYFVDLGVDTIRHLYIPSYFEEMLKETGDIFSKALLLYTQRIVKPEYHQQLEKFCDYNYVETQLNKNANLEFTYQKTNGDWLKLRILKFKTYTPQCRETLWIFSSIDS